jgi:acetolactate synthase-1/2/3 large subunit
MSDVQSQAVSKIGGHILVDALLRNGVDTVYCVPGESYLPVLDALHDATAIRTIVTRHEGAASNMADAYGKLTGRPGICFVTRGPGATHASNGVHTAMQDSTPMILFVGQIEGKFRGREAFQEVDYGRMFGGLAKWATEIDDLERIPEIIARAFTVAMSGRPGPVVIGLPEEVLFGMGNPPATPSVHIAHAAPDAASLAEVSALLAKASKPLVILGGTGWKEDGLAALKRFVEKYNLPVAASFRRQDLFDNRDPHYVGQLGLGVSAELAQRVKDADLLLVIGSRLSETVSQGYTLIECPQPQKAMIHVHPDPNELGRVYHAQLPILASLNQFALALDASSSTVTATSWSDWTKSARSNYVAHSTPAPSHAELAGVDLAHVVNHLSNVLPEDAVIANGAGNYTVWVHRYYRYRRPATELAPTNGAMGYGLPAAIAAKLRNTSQTVVCFAGDGCFMMYPQELITAIQYGAPLVVIVVNNGMLGTIRMHQEREYPNRVSGTNLANPDFVDFARSFGAYAQRVERTEDFALAFERASSAGVPALLELRTDPRQITPASRLD